MRSFTGSGGAIFLLDRATESGAVGLRPEHLGPGWQTQDTGMVGLCVADLDGWKMYVNDVSDGEPVLGGHSMQHKRGDTTFTLTPANVPAPLQPGDKVAFQLPFFGGHIEATADVNDQLIASAQRGGALQITDPKEVIFVP